ncbi:MAG: hypothetical protein JWR80_6195 [Bradyrhizobium sp.]|nr:hypothetical protein [Bradyrhizobium sp.]
MEGRLRKRGKGVAVCIPDTVMSAASLNVGDHVDVRYENGRIIIEALCPGDVRSAEAG